MGIRTPYTHMQHRTGAAPGYGLQHWTAGVSDMCSQVSTARGRLPELHAALSRMAIRVCECGSEGACLFYLIQRLWFRGG